MRLLSIKMISAVAATSEEGAKNIPVSTSPSSPQTKYVITVSARVLIPFTCVAMASAFLAGRMASHFWRREVFWSPSLEWSELPKVERDASFSWARWNDDDGGEQVCQPEGNLSALGNTCYSYDDEEAMRTGLLVKVAIENVDRSMINSTQRLTASMIDLHKKANLNLHTYQCHDIMDQTRLRCVGLFKQNKGHVSIYAFPLSGVVFVDIFAGDQEWRPSLVTLVEELFGGEQASPSNCQGAPHILWTQQKRGFRFKEGDLSSVEHLLGNPRLKKEHIATTKTSLQNTIHIYDIYDDIKAQSCEPYNKSHLANAFQSSTLQDLMQTDRVVYLDGIIHSRRFGERAYHEALVHAGLFLHKNPKRVAIIGGGTGASLREVLKHNTVDKVAMIGDEMMVKSSRKHLQAWSDCSDIAGSAANCLEDPRVEIYHEDAITSFFDGSLIKEAQKFDVIVFDALEPNSVLGFSDTLHGGELYESIYQSLTDLGVVIAPVGQADRFNDLPYSHASNDHFKTFLDGWLTAKFESITTYVEMHGRLSVPLKFMVAMKHYQVRENWFRNQAEIELAMHTRLLSTVSGEMPLRYFDGATMMSYVFPTRIAEEVWCRQEPTPDGCKPGHGFDPRIPNFATTSTLEVRKGTIENSGRGVYAKERIPKGSFIGLDECTSAWFLPASTNSLAFDGLKFDHDFFDALVNGYVEGYGWSVNFLGDEAAGVDPGIVTFTNHGCNGTYNLGDRLPFTEMSLDADRGPEGLYNDQFYEYDPYSERHYPGWECDKSCEALRTIEAGEELLTNYLSFYGDCKLGWQQAVVELKSLCSGGLGSVSQYEAKAMEAGDDDATA